MVRVANEYLACACRVQQDNPKKNMSADRYERYKAARTLQQVLDLGGSRGDIANDMLRGYIVVEDREIHEAILMTANESERRHLPAHLLGRLPPAAPGAGFEPPDGPANEIARTIAALDDSGEVGRRHLEEALALACAGEGRP